jgi:peptidoglycan hydrolase-like protein with peptidoglycan-binding domain
VQAVVDAVCRPLFACVLVALALACTTGIAAADLSGGASAASEIVVERGDRGEAVRKIQSALGISADGVFGPQTEGAVKRFQRSKDLVVDGVVGPHTRGALGLQPFTSRSLSRGSRSTPVPQILRLIAECESGGDPTQVSPGGRYRGKYQFSMGTWQAMGGVGDPAAAPEWLQDRIALKLYRRHGTWPWPNCP